MKTKTTISDFEFAFTGYGHYLVSYKSPITGKVWRKTINDMTIIDATKNSDDPKQSDIERLKRIVKN